MRPRTKEELARQFDSSQWRDAFINLLSVVSFLRESIITSDYKIPDELNDLIVLSESGNKLATELVTKQQVPAKEARLTCLLVTAWIDLLVDVEAIDLDKLISICSKQILNGQIRHPFIYGRDLYDRAADLFPDERSYISAEDTKRLLDRTPVGVFQLGPFLSGPYGLVRTSTARHLPPTNYVPLQHCADKSCTRVHRVQLTTNIDAPINSHRPKMTRLLEKDGQEPSDWNGFISDLIERSFDPLNDRGAASVPFLLGDALEDAELRLVVEWLMDETKGTFRGAVAALGVRGSASAAVDGLSRAHLIQLSMMAPDLQLADALDVLARNGLLEIPRGEVRSARVNGARRSGEWGVRAELSRLGLRLQSADPHVAQLRLVRLARSMYDADNIEDMQALEWSLRGVEGLTLQNRLADYIRRSRPRDVLTTLMLARKESAERAAREVDLSGYEMMNDGELIDAVMWKLGSPYDEPTNIASEFWASHDRLENFVAAAAIDSLADERAIRSEASNYFVSLERVLDDAICYATWALTNDHYSSEAPFVYRPSLDAAVSKEALSTEASELDEGLNYSGNVGLYALMRGPEVLSKLLGRVEESEGDHIRPSHTLPPFATGTSLQNFPFAHEVPFLDLLPSARASIKQRLHFVSSTLVSAGVNETRNDWMHYRRLTADLDALSAMLDAVRKALGHLDTLGFLRLPYRLLSEEVDAWGRSRIRLASARGEVTFPRPSPYDWLQMPILHSSQYLVHSAKFAEPNEVLRFGVSEDSPFSRMWMNYPRRRRPSAIAIADQSETATSSLESGSSGTLRMG